MFNRKKAALKVSVNILTQCLVFLFLQVRISAGIALSTPKQRDSYGKEELFSSIWISIVDALLSSEELSDFTEFRFKHNLQKKVRYPFLYFRFVKVFLLSAPMSSEVSFLTPPPRIVFSLKNSLGNL